MKNSKIIKIKKSNLIGWQEWFSIPDLSITAIKGKIDTGAKTSAMHSEDLRFYRIKGQEWVEFKVYPTKKTNQSAILCKAPILEYRSISDSGGRREVRPIIVIDISINNLKVPIDLSLTNRATMSFDLLIGRDAIKKMKMLVNPSKSFIQGRLLNN